VSVARVDARRRCPPDRSRAAPYSKPGSTSCPSPGPGPSQRSRGCRFQRSCPAHARTIMTHFTTRERGTGTVLYRPDNSQRQGSIGSLISRLNRVHYSTFVFVEILRSFEVYLDTPSSLASSRVNIFFLHFRKFLSLKVRSRVGRALGFSARRSLNSLVFPPQFYRRYIRQRGGMHDARVSVVSTDYSSLFTTTCTSFGWNAIGFSPVVRGIGQGFLHLRIPICRAAYVNETVSLYVAPTSYTIWHFVNSRKTPDSPSCCCQ